MEISKKILEFLEPLNIRADAISELYDNMIDSKETINTKLGLNKGNDFRLVIPYSMNDDIFKATYPETYKYIGTLVGDYEFNLSENWIKTPKKVKLSKFISKLPDIIYEDSEIGIKDISTIFDIVKPKNIVISTNMYDFITSASNSSFRSCYSIDGSHFNGNIAYMQDKFTFMIYTYSSDINRKIGRMWAYYPDAEQSMFLTSKIYASIYENEKKIASNAISKLISPDEKWNETNVEYENYTNARPKRDFPIPVYFDYSEITVHHTSNLIDKNNLPTLRFKNISCLECGVITRNGYYGMCEDCGENIKRCNYCSKPLHYKNMVNDEYTCKECYDKYYDTCTGCGTYCFMSTQNHIKGKKYCTRCYNNRHRSCKICNTYQLVEDLIKYDSHYVCKECNDQLELSNCSRCSRLMIAEEGIPDIYYNGYKICTKCSVVLNETSNEGMNWELLTSTVSGDISVNLNVNENKIRISFYGKNVFNKLIMFNKIVSYTDFAIVAGIDINDMTSEIIMNTSENIVRDKLNENNMSIQSVWYDDIPTFHINNIS